MPKYDDSYDLFMICLVGFQAFLYGQLHAAGATFYKRFFADFRLGWSASQGGHSQKRDCYEDYLAHGTLPFGLWPVQFLVRKTYGMMIIL
jgi:hypothetical protein